MQNHSKGNFDRIVEDYSKLPNTKGSNSSVFKEFMGIKLVIPQNYTQPTYGTVIPDAINYNRILLKAIKSDSTLNIVQDQVYEIHEVSSYTTNFEDSVFWIRNLRTNVFTYFMVDEYELFTICPKNTEEEFWNDYFKMLNNIPRDRENYDKLLEIVLNSPADKFDQISYICTFKNLTYISNYKLDVVIYYLSHLSKYLKIEQEFLDKILQ